MLAPFILGIVGIIAFVVWEVKFAPYPMVPAKLFSKDKRTMTAILLVTFWSGGNYFVLLLLWPTQCYNVYGMLTLLIKNRGLTNARRRPDRDWHSSFAHWLWYHFWSCHSPNTHPSRKGPHHTVDDILMCPDDSR